MPPAKRARQQRVRRNTKKVKARNRANVRKRKKARSKLKGRTNL